MNKKYVVLTGITLIAILGLGLYFVNAAEAGYHPYYPLKPGNQWLYRMILPDKNEVIRTVGVTTPEKEISRMLVLINKNPFAEIHFVQTSKGIFKVKEISGSGINSVDPFQMIIPVDVKAGMTWNWESADKKSKEAAKVIGFEKVTVPAGTYDALLIEYTGNSEGVSYVEKAWFVKDIGNVKTVSTSTDKTTTLELISYKFLDK